MSANFFLMVVKKPAFCMLFSLELDVDNVAGLFREQIILPIPFRFVFQLQYQTG